MQYKSNRIIDRKPKWVIVNENGEIINNNPSKEELKGLEKEPYFVQRKKQYSNEELLRHLKRFYEENGRVPQRRDFINNPDYPGFYIYILSVLEAGITL